MTIKTVEIGHGVGYAQGPNGLTAWVVLDGKKVGKIYKGENAHTNAERDAFDVASERAFQ
jgi:hypothetical protein